jgi:hypothetical protein
VKIEGFGWGGVVAAAFGNMQVAGVFESCGNGGADGGQVGRPAAGAAGGGVFTECDVPDLLSGCKPDIKCVFAKRAGRSQGKTSPTAASGVAYVARPSSAGL